MAQFLWYFVLSIISLLVIRSVLLNQGKGVSLWNIELKEQAINNIDPVLSRYIYCKNSSSHHDRSCGSNLTRTDIHMTPIIPAVYTTHDIAMTVSLLGDGLPGAVLLYDPITDSFRTMGVIDLDRAPSKHHPFPHGHHRYKLLVTLLVHTLKRVRPHRFRPDQPLYQLFFTDLDFTYVNCGTTQHPCDSNIENETNAPAPWIHFGSYFRNKSILSPDAANSSDKVTQHRGSSSFLQVIPHPDYLECMFQMLTDPNMTECTTWSHVLASSQNHKSFEKWVDELIPTVVWRGSDFPFLHSLTSHEFFFPDKFKVPEIPFSPRRVAVAMSLNISSSQAMVNDSQGIRNTTSWLNAKFGQNENRMSFEELSQYRYQLDLGGAGGTSWRGTLEKLFMPGVLFHHETPAQDWFYDEMQPWVHYVPIRTDLSDLHEQYQWAEAHLEEAYQISQRGTAFVRDLFSPKRLREEVELHFGATSMLGSVVDAYEALTSHNTVGAANESMDFILSEYTQQGIAYTEFANCSQEFCYFPAGRGTVIRYEISTNICTISATRDGRRIGRRCN